MEKKNFSEEQSGSKPFEKNIIALGFVAFFGGLSQDMIVPILPLFYSQILGLPKGTIGIIEGSVTTIVSLFKIISGILSDKLGKRKSMVFLGYLLSAIGRFLLSITNGAIMTFGLRSIDGIGKGVKDAPRDALVAKSSQKNKTGFAFGFQRMLDTLGSFVGPLITTGLIIVLRRLPQFSFYRIIFFIAGLVAFIPIFIINFYVKENAGNKINANFRFDFSLLKGKFLVFYVTVLIFTLGNSSDAFLILRAQNVGIQPITIPVIFAIFNLIYALLSVPSGILSDRIGRVNVIRFGWLLYAVTYLGFALARSPWHIWVLYVIYGIYYSTTEGIAKSLIVHLVPETHRGTAFGLYNASIGLFALPASGIAGYLWDKFSPAMPFYFGSLCSIIAVFLISLLKIE